jgi:hypothetical protein
MDKIQFIQTTPHQLAELIDEKVKISLSALKDELLNKNSNDELLTRAQACEFLQIEQTTLYHWTNSCKLVAYGIGNRRYYKRSELLEALQLVKK